LIDWLTDYLTVRFVVTVKKLNTDYGSLI